MKLDDLDAGACAQWDPPVPLSAAADLPSFPVGIYPGWLADEVAALAEFTQTPVDLPGTIALSVLAAAVGGRAVAEIRGSWSEPLNLYVVTVLPPGTRKSAVHAELTAPLLYAEQQMAADASARIAEARTQRGVADRATEKAIAEAARKNTTEATAEAVAAAHLAEAITVPVMPRIVADDVTPEAAASLLAEQGGRLAILSAEGGCFATLAGRYSGQPNLEVFLKGHAGDMLRVDRKGRQPEHIPHPALTLGLTVQPDVLKAIADMPGFRGRGLLARILYSLPASTVGHRKIRTDPVAEEMAAAYDMNVRALVHTFAEWTDPAIIQLTPEAAELLLAAAETLEPRLAPDGDLGHIADWASKLIGAIARIAGLLHLAEHLRDGWATPVSEATMENAIRAGGYFARHALAAFDGMGADPALDGARAALQWIKRNGEATFTRRALHRGLQSRFRKAADLEPALAILQDHGWIAAAAQAPDSGPGRPRSATYDVNPALLSESQTS